MTRMTLNRSRIAAGLALVFALGALYWLLHDPAAIATVLDAGALKPAVGKLGPWGAARGDQADQTPQN